MAHAAMPVDAVTYTESGTAARDRRAFTSRLRRKDFPVPALPVKNTFLPDRTNSITSCIQGAQTHQGKHNIGDEGR